MGLGSTIVSIILTFVLTSVAANLLVQRWQQRNWLSQQRFLGNEKEYESLKKLFDEITVLAGKRITRMRRLLWAMTLSDDSLVQRRLAEYDEAQKEWNDNLGSFFARTKLLGGRRLFERLEERVQAAFVANGAVLEQEVKKRGSRRPLDQKTANALEERLNSLQGELNDFDSAMLQAVENKKKETYFGVELELRWDTLETFQTGDLVKALFKPRIPPYRIVRTAADLGEPARSRH
jgi:hypothetical protein